MNNHVSERALFFKICFSFIQAKQTEIARILGVSQCQVSKLFKNEQYNPKLDEYVILRIKDFLKQQVIEENDNKAISYN